MGKEDQALFQTMPPWLIPESGPEIFWKIAAKLSFTMSW